MIAVMAAGDTRTRLVTDRQGPKARVHVPAPGFAVDALDRSETVLGRAVTVARLSGSSPDEDHRRRKKKKQKERRQEEEKKLKAKKSNNGIIYIHTS